MANAYNEIEVIHQNLIDAGCDDEDINMCLNIMKDNNIKAILPRLKNQRKLLLHKLHEDKERIECLDYLIYQINKK